MVDLDSKLASDTSLTHLPKIHWSSLLYGPVTKMASKSRSVLAAHGTPKAGPLVLLSLDVFSYNVGKVPFFGVGWIKLEDTAGPGRMCPRGRGV